LSAIATWNSLPVLDISGTGLRTLYSTVFQPEHERHDPWHDEVELLLDRQAPGGGQHLVSERQEVVHEQEVAPDRIQARTADGGPGCQQEVVGRHDPERSPQVEPAETHGRAVPQRREQHPPDQEAAEHEEGIDPEICVIEESRPSG
jgi:hypothetical protein